MLYITIVTRMERMERMEPKNTDRPHRNLFSILKLTERPTEGDQVLTGAFHATMDKIVADILQVVKKWNWIDHV